MTLVGHGNTTIMSSDDGSENNIHLIIMAVINGISSIAGIIGNTLVLIVLFQDREHFQGISLFITALAIADLTVCSVVQPVFIYLLFGAFQEADFIRVFENNVFAILIQVSLNLLLSIAIFRFVDVLYPFFYRKFATKFRVCVVIAAVCIISAVQGVLFNNKLMQHAEPFFQYATIAAFLFFYGKIFLVAKKHQNEIVCQTRSLAFNHSGMTVARFTRLKNSTITTGIITGAFVLCLLPFSIVNLIDDAILETAEDDVVTYWVTTIVCCNSSMNAYIYTLRSKSFKNAVAKTLRFLKCFGHTEEH